MACPLLMKTAMVMVLVTALAPAGWAHSPMSHDCVAPVRPADEQDDVRWQAFLDAVSRFQSCISAEMDRQRAASAGHLEAAGAAADEWNRFVHESLNAPEDYPWPPE